MSADYLGEIRIYGGEVPPKDWVICDGSLLSIADNHDLFALIGTTYGGDGLNTFAVPDLRGRLPVHRTVGMPPGDTGGVETVSLTAAQMPNHNHYWFASTMTATLPSPEHNVLGNQALARIYVEDAPGTQLAAATLTPAGEGQPHTNLQPFTCVNFIMALYGPIPRPGLAAPPEGEPYLGEIRIFPFGFYPSGWAHCDGYLVPIAFNDALYSILGTTYGGDGITTFGLPDLRGRAPMDAGDAPGLSPRRLGQTGGTETVTLDLAQIHAHGHFAQASTEPGELQGPGPAQVLARSSGANLYVVPPQPPQPPLPLVPMADATVVPSGGSQPHNNMQPYLAFNFCIALQGEFPHP